MLMYLGARKVYLLDRGWNAWVGSGGTVEIEAAQVGHASFEVSPHPEHRRTLPELRTALAMGATIRFIDTRYPEEYRGLVQEYLPRPGRLPGVRLVPFLRCSRKMAAMPEVSACCLGFRPQCQERLPTVK
jgi:thiosulfate/3-mercaptopyruvate sulfurtransferase